MEGRWWKQIEMKLWVASYCVMAHNLLQAWNGKPCISLIAFGFVSTNCSPTLTVVIICILLIYVNLLCVYFGCNAESVSFPWEKFITTIPLVYPEVESV